MAIPPFPSPDLAKLVLGYLIEEQLMTAYDEFLNVSPYLDAQKNEYDRVMMNSLRNILAEYRATRIYVETCKPVALRRRLFQCSNLLEIVKLLVTYIDIKKLQEDLSRDLISTDSHEATTSRIGCDACNSSKLGSCVCSNKRTVSSSKSVNNSESLEAGRNLAQATSLSDLPGNQVPENKNSRVPEHQSNQSSVINLQEILTNVYPVANNANVGQNSINPSLQANSNTTALQCSQNIADFNTVLHQVQYNNSAVTRNFKNYSHLASSENADNRIPIAGSFQDFTAGVKGASISNVNIPDSSTTENINVPCSEKNLKTQKKKCVFRLGNVKHDVTEITSEVIDVDSLPSNAPSNPKPEEQKVTILSNVRVGNDDRPTLAPKNATSTPLLHMQTIYINGTPVYKPKPVEQKYTFTRDEIMAMPTIILVPTSGPSKVAAPICVQPQAMSAQNSNITTSTPCHIAPTLPPLTVDVSSNSSNVTCKVPIDNNTQEITVQDNSSKSGLVKTVEVLKNASVPKDNIVSGSISTSTPHALPPKRKSSSTPRRTSHVRVLDFTTPRRILNETINENPDQDTDLDKPAEVMISKIPNVSFPRDSIAVDNNGHLETTTETDLKNNIVLKTAELNKTDKKKTVARKTNWDADLRALVAASEGVNNYTPPVKRKSKKKHVKNATIEIETVKNTTTVTNAVRTRKKSSLKNNVTSNTKKEDKVDIVEKPEDKVPSPNVSPVGIASPLKKVTSGENENSQNKSNDEERIDTPEVERLSLRNEIGAKLNISDILETPYKQALYEIQMETPRFLGPELPDDPMSDIKITDIPTPRFLSTNMPITPKPTQATPSSYSSRPTDYSSGGSYYKPDDQDYLPTFDDMACPVTSTHSKDNSNITTSEATTELPKENQPKEKSKKNRSRPVRQCAKNVSYYNNIPMISKNTDANKRDDESSCSDTFSGNSSLDITVKDNTTISKGDKIRQSIKQGTKKNLSLAKKRSPVKRNTQKPFMKIKPRRPTPTKNSGRKNRKSSETQVALKGKPRIKNTSKDKVSGSPSLAVPAHTKSRRKSSTPRKLHCTKTFHSESSGHESSEAENKEVAHSPNQNSRVSCLQDSDTEQLPLRWSDDGSQNTRLQAGIEPTVDNETDDISKIKEYIDKTVPTVLSRKVNEGSLQNDLIKRGFDIETAKIIERDLLNTHVEDTPNLRQNDNKTKNNRILERSVESDCSTLTSNLVIIEEDDPDDFEFSVHECTEGSENYFNVQHVESKPTSGENVSKLKDKFSMEVCIDEGIVVRLRASSFHNLFNQDPYDFGVGNETYRETELAVSSISNMDRLYTPMKDPIKAQCFEIFDSTLTSIDTPVKVNSPKRKQDATVSEIVLDSENVEKNEVKEKTENRKRKRIHCSSAPEESANGTKKVKPEAQFILQTKDIKDMDIEVLLTKLHGS